MSWLDILTSGTIGSALGAIVGVGDKYLTHTMALKTKKVENAHIEKMHGLQSEQDRYMAEQKLIETSITADQAILVGSYEHDSSFKDTSPWVNNIRALVRPVSLGIGFALTVYNPVVFSGFLGTMISWWYASRTRTI